MPDQIDEEGMLIGWSLEHEYGIPPIGFNYGNQRFTPANGFLNPILFNGEGHMMTIAPTGSGKGTGCIIPTLLRHKGPVIVIDPKGENATVTARRRKELGQKVVVLDPLRIWDGEPDRLNPFDLLDRESASLTDDAAMLMNILVPAEVDARSRFWVSRAQQILIGLTLHLMADCGLKHHNLTALYEIVNQGPRKLDEVARAMSKSKHPDVRAISSNLLNPAAETLGGIMSYAQDAVAFMRGELVQEATSNSTFSFDAITRGDPISLFLIIPSDKLESHGPLLKIWIGALMAAISRRQAPPPDPTLFVLDEAAQLGKLPQLRQAITLLRGYGLQTWSFWQDVSQLYRLYPSDWETMVNNCKVIQSFGANNLNAAHSVSKLTGYPRPREILDLDYNEMILLIGGDEAVIAQKPDYLKDPMFRGMFDNNPLHDRSREIMPRPRRAQRVYRRPPKPTRSPSGHPVHPPQPIWSEWERNAMGEVTGVRRLEGKKLETRVSASLRNPKLDEWSMPPIIQGDWKIVPDHRALVNLVRIWPELVPNFGHNITAIDAVRRTKVNFYSDTWLYEARCVDGEEFAGYLTWIANDEHVVQLTGNSPPIHHLNSMIPIELTNSDIAAQYLEFFCSAVHGQAGAFRVITSPDALRWESEPEDPLPEDVMRKLHPVEMKRVEPEQEEKKDPVWTTECAVQYADALFQSEFVVQDDGAVLMLNDQPLVEDRPFQVEMFAAGVRKFES